MVLGFGHHLGLEIILPVIEYVLLACVVTNLSLTVSPGLSTGVRLRHLSIPPPGAQSHLPVSSSGDLAGAVLGRRTGS